jgi:DNA repair protein RecO (recombination protein O)
LISAIIKGGRRPKSKLAAVVDLLNHIQVIIYSKETREIQIITSADLVSYYPKIKSNLNFSKYAYAVCELIKNLLADNEAHELLFNGLVKIFNLMEKKSEHPAILFGRFLLFFIREIGYEIIIDKCAICSNQLVPELKPKHFLNRGFICINCYDKKINNSYTNSELFNYLFCLKTRNKILSDDEKLFESGNQFLIDYLKNHVESFKGLNSLTIL